jgi:hypothetical protein
LLLLTLQFVGGLTVTDELRKFLDNLPAERPRSRLDPFRSFILRWRREGRPYRRIQQILAEHCRVTVTHETLRRFIKRRARQSKSQPEMESEVPPIASAQTLPAPVPGRRLTPDERAAQVEFIRSLNKPEVVVERPKPLFDPDLSKPRTKVRQQGD